tara:strand:+ start:441 stop:698 length:258 start_codon:yes stop_codon:yes gene_type:complete
MKYLFLITTMFIFISCNTSTKYIKPFPKIEEFKAFETIGYGDERWDDCEDIYVITYGITYDNDTLMIRKRMKYNCGTYDYTTWTD